MKYLRYARPALALVLVLASLLFLPSCSKYRLELSSAEQTRTVLTVDGAEVPFELLYFFYKSAVDVETHEGKLAAARGDVAELYSIFAVCRANGIDPFGEDIENELTEAVREMIDSFRTRREYIESLTARFMTDSVSRLLLRASLCQERLLVALAEGRVASDEEIIAFCEDENVIRTLSLIVHYGQYESWAQTRAAEIEAALAMADTDEGFLDVAHRMATGQEEHGYMTLRQWQNLFGEGALTPAVGVVSEPLFDGSSFLILRVAEKDLAYVRENVDRVAPAYIEYLFEEERIRVLATVTEAEAYATLTAESFS